MEARLEKFDKIVYDFLEKESLAFATIDNINIYRGTVTHWGLFKKLGPRMWNFTGRYLFRPKLTGIDKTLLQDFDLCNNPQKKIDTVTAKDVIIG